MPTGPQDFRDYHTARYQFPLTENGDTFGSCVTHVEIRRKRDVQNLKSEPGFVVMMRQRIIVPNTQPPQLGAVSKNEFMNYPAILVNEVNMHLSRPVSGVTPVLRHMFPKTLNAEVSSSSSATDGSADTKTNEATRGSSTSTINSYGVSVEGGSSGFGGSYNRSHSSEQTHSSSATSGLSSATNYNSSSSASMSVKDWSAFGFLPLADQDYTAHSPSWVWGQSYPWDVLSFHQMDPAAIPYILLPIHVYNRMVDVLPGSDEKRQIVSPPSQLSEFGLEFVMTAEWELNFPSGIELTEPALIMINNDVILYTASHWLEDTTEATYMLASLESEEEARICKLKLPLLDLSSYALDPISSLEGSDEAVIGFTTAPFSVPTTAQQFEVVSPANNLQIRGQGFNLVPNTGLQTDLSSEATALTVTFKIADTTVDYALMFMHWIAADSTDPLGLVWCVNQNPDWKGIHIVSSSEGEGGQNNFSSIELRNTDFRSINFHDYLVIGMNTVEIRLVDPDDVSTPLVEYTLFAMAVGPSVATD